jgi:A/G-specific adenine glycosylase
VTSETPETAPHCLSAQDARRLLQWHRGHRREYPWRLESEPYRIVVTELMLVRTRADQVAGVWQSFFKAYPTIEFLARAPQNEVTESLRPLGLAWRAVMVARFASAAVHDQDWPSHLSELPGCGPYVADAVTLARLGRGRLPVDVTIARVIARYWALSPNGEPRRDGGVLAHAEAMGVRSRRFFHAWLDLAAAACKPGTPHCEQCPLLCCLSRGRIRVTSERPRRLAPEM